MAPLSTRCSKSYPCYFQSISQTWIWSSHPHSYYHALSNHLSPARPSLPDSPNKIRVNFEIHKSEHATPCLQLLTAFPWHPPTRLLASWMILPLFPSLPAPSSRQSFRLFSALAALARAMPSGYVLSLLRSQSLVPTPLQENKPSPVTFLSLSPPVSLTALGPVYLYIVWLAPLLDSAFGTVLSIAFLFTNA